MNIIPLLRLALPLMLTGLVQSSMYFFENIFIARLGSQEFAAGALVSWLFATFIVVIFGTFSSVNVLVALKYGEKDDKAISRILRDALIIACSVMLPFFFLFRNIAPFFYNLGQQPELVSLASEYLDALSWGLFPKFILIVMYEFLLGLGHARVITLFVLVTVPLYVIASWAFIFGKFGLPACGIAGAGWGMTAGDWIATIGLALYLFYNKSYQHYFSELKLSTPITYVREMLHIGLPMGLMFSVEVAFFFVMSLLIGRIGIHELAANQVAMQYLGMLMSTIFSLSQAVTTRMGHQIGANEGIQVRQTAYAGVFIAFIYMAIIALIYLYYRDLLIAIDFGQYKHSNHETIILASQFLLIAALFQIPEAIRITLFGALRALKDTRFTLLMSILSFWCIALPVGYFLSSYYDFGGAAYWWGMVLGAICSMALLFYRLKQKLHMLELVR